MVKINGSSFPHQYRRTNPFPIDSTETWDTLEDATAYARNTDTDAYMPYTGQVISIEGKDDLYVLVEDETISKADGRNHFKLHKVSTEEDSSEKYLSKVVEDRAKKLIHFDEGIDVKGGVQTDTVTATEGITGKTITATDTVKGNNVQAVDTVSGKNATISAKTTTLNLLVQALADTYDLSVSHVATMTGTIVKDYISSESYVSGMSGNGMKIYKALNGDWNMELDNLTVRKIFTVFELVVQKIVHQGGMVIRSAAGGKLAKVTDGGTYWKCEYDSTDDFVKDDQIVCQAFTGTVIKRYWRLVTSAGAGYFNLSKSDCEAGSGTPEVGDDVSVLGNRTNTARQKAQIDCAVGDTAPYRDDYAGINSYSLAGKLITRTGELSGITDAVFGVLSGSGLYATNVYLKGMFILRSGKSVESELNAVNAAVIAAQNAASTAQSTADAAKANATAANDLLSDIANDNKLTPTEKQSTKKEWDIIMSEKVKNDASADMFNVDKAAYGTVYSALNTYITPLLSSLTTTSAITGADFRAKFKAYYDARTDLLNAISAKAKSLADAAQTKADAAGNAASAAQKDATAAKTAAGAAQTTANNAVTSANGANALLSDIASDSKLTPTEKQQTKKEWDVIVSEKPLNNASAVKFGVATTSYDAAYNTLNTYITPLLASLTTTSDIVGTTFRNTFKVYYDTRTNLLNAISAAAKVLADNAQASVDNLQVGGRNLLLDSKLSLSGTSYNISFWNCVRDFTVGEELTVTVKGNTSGTKLFGIWFNSDKIESGSLLKVEDGIYSKTIKVPAGTTNRRIGLFLRGNSPATDSWSFEWIKLETGNRRTDWTPAPEDLDAKITTIETNFEIREGQISSKITEVTKTVTEATTSATNAKTSETNASNSATTAGQKATAAATSATNAKNSADASAVVLQTVSTKQSEINAKADQITLKVTEVTEKTVQATNAAELATAMSKGKMLYRDPTFESWLNGIGAYNNSGGGTVTVTRVSSVAGNPNGSGYCLKIMTTGASSPGWGGFLQAPTVKANQCLVYRFIANIPVGRTLSYARNDAGNGVSEKWLTSKSGTGNWEEYVYVLHCGATGTFSGCGHFYLTGGSTPTASAPLIWYLSYATVFDVTDAEVDYIADAAGKYTTKTTYEAGIKVLSDSITSKVSQTDFNALGNRVINAETTITQHTGQIALKASQSDVTALGTRMSSAEAKITPDAIKLTVKSQTETIAADTVKDRPTTETIKSQIALDGFGISVFGKKIDFTGKVTFSSMDSATQSTINGKATTGYVDTAKSSAISTAASDAQSKADSAKSSAISTAANDATTKANNAKSAAISAAATDATTKANNALSTSRNDVAVKLGYSSYTDMVNKATASQTIINGGYIRTSLIQANTITADKIATGTITADKLNIGNVQAQILTADAIQALDITTGKLKVTTGATIGGFKVDGINMCNRDNQECWISIDRTVGSTRRISSLGNNIPSTAGIDTAGYFSATGPNENRALVLNASGSNYHEWSGGKTNFAIDAVGGCKWKMKEGDHWSMPGLLGIIRFLCTFSGNSYNYTMQRIWGHGIPLVYVRRFSVPDLLIDVEMEMGTSFYSLTGQSVGPSPIGGIWDSTFVIESLSQHGFIFSCWRNGIKFIPRQVDIFIFGDPV